MSWRLLAFFVKHEWRSLVRRNLAGILAGLAPIAVSPLIGFMCASMAHTLQDIGEYDPGLIEGYVLMGGLGALSMFPILFAVFLTSDAIVLETELGTIELILWAPVKERELLMGKALLPYFLNTFSGFSMFVLFSLSYLVGTNAVGYDASPWSTVGLLFTLLLIILLAATVLGILISSLSTNTKAAATTSLSVGGLMMLLETGVGAVLAMNGTAPRGIVAVLAVANLAVAVVAAMAVIQRFGHRESYFLKRAGRGRHDTPA